MSATGLDANGDLLPFHVDNRDPEQVAMEYLAARRAGKSIEEAITVPPPPHAMTGDREIKTVPAEVKEEPEFCVEGQCVGTCPDGDFCQESEDDPLPGGPYESAPEGYAERVVDVVNHPPHYDFGLIEVIDVLEDWNVSYMLGNVIKYVARSPHKGKQIEDLRKAQFYLNREIERLEREAGS